MGSLRARIKRAELAGSLGALVLGVGLAGAVPRLVGSAWPAVASVGLAVHAWGMWDKHRIEAGSVRFAAWEAALYWICWILLAMVQAYLLLRSV